MDLEQGLGLFGLPGFRPGQREAIEMLLGHGRLLFVAPTGGGKSLIFQLPAVLLPGTTIVVCPLVSLMKDQVASLERKGIPATYFASTLDGPEQSRRTQQLLAGAYKFLYVAPERLSSPRFRALALEFECPLVAIDESHCISEWGHDFRPEYLRIGEFLDVCRPPRVLAVTATATPRVQDEIVERLGLGVDAPRIVRGFGRTNLALYVRRVRNRGERDRLVDESLEQAFGAPGSSGAAVVYAPTRRIAEEEAARLSASGRWRCLAYHAGLPNEVRDAAQDAFCSGAIDVVVATNAFGMGIDRSDVRLVIHLGPPGSIESYYQEVGRGGRDGLEAVGVLLLGREEIALRQRFVESAGTVSESGAASPGTLGTEIAFTGREGASPEGTGRERPGVDSTVPEGTGARGTESGHPGWPPAPPVSLGAGERRQALFDDFMRWAMGRGCRHEGILRYFGEDVNRIEPCGKCDVCERRARRPGTARRLTRWSALLERLRRSTGR